MTEYVYIGEAAEQSGVSTNRIRQLIHSSRIRAIKRSSFWHVDVDDVATLTREQSYFERRDVCSTLKITAREFDLLVKKGLLIPKNIISEFALFDPIEVFAALKVVADSCSIDEAARRLGKSKRTVHRMISSGTLKSVETVHGQRIPLDELP